MYDTRNYAKKERMNRPHVLVCANQLPMFDQASLDRWVVFDIGENGELVNKTADVILEHQQRRALASKERQEDAAIAETKRSERVVAFLEGHAEHMVREQFEEIDSRYQARKRELAQRSRSPVRGH